MDEKKLLKYAVDYLSKYESSKKNLAFILRRKIFKLNILGKEKSKLLNIVETIILKLEKNKLIDDDRYTLSKMSNLLNSGKSKNYIFNYLIKKGVDKKIINNNFNIIKDEDNNWELKAAKLFARKKKLVNLNISFEKKLAKMARAGFSYEICKKILG